MIRIYTYANNRPDLIEIQKKSFDKFIKNDFKFVVFNNAYDSSDVRCDTPLEVRYRGIEEACLANGIESRRIDIESLERSTKFEGQEHLNIQNGEYTFGNVAMSCPLNGTWPGIISESDPDDIIVLIDTDMFFTREFDVDDFIKDHDIAYVPQYRGTKDDSASVHYAWNGIFMARASTPGLSEMDWFCGTVNGHKVDVGGQTHHFLKNYPDTRKKVIEVYNIVALNSNTDARFVDCHLNGNFRWTFVTHYRSNHVQVANPTTELARGQKLLPYMIDDESRIQRIYGIIDEMCNAAQEHGFPTPVWFDFVGHEDSKSLSDCFIFHYKSGSNYMGFSNQEYNRLKTRALRSLLGV